MIQIYEWVNSLVAIDNELFELKLSIELNEKEYARWSNYIDSDGDLAKHQTFLTSLEKQNHLKGVIKELNQRVEQLEKERKEIIELIDKFKGLNQKILKLKYVEGLTLEAIAKETGYSYQYIKNKHAEIMRMVQFSKKV
ncbi:sigma-70 family RNA polymerase sigma factor [Enterococcus faecalis]|uniref:sigma-70 family RNA polymerase sigma factor n=1 Tax=Enterococcus TaxID=1350 RepID=UPI000A818A5A|nr:sigma-70 family RNA polymerase sigma factor [Enterococcus faecalis]MDU3876538.1 sigma-70 family RNA polymerase sigma factor [Klebsiella aerogenes]EHQ8838300.1 sigma-70 family RNA polymerase sigma factor [Enterococcus faecalis]EIW2162373.1 sigma-70 family RNA polymerase sigma factor [Enterococcus faecalis]MDK7972180.1 sigma-70 family RNA polymerase sigma factor [Enterococcus faecalis]MDK8223534.1 sigma-70 family RNA polymerase sigma factor [Enterococcus faecalis]